jgi:phasin family protein
MTNTLEQAREVNRVELQEMENLTEYAYAKVERLIRLNMSACGALLEESIGHVRALMAAKDVTEVWNLQMGQWQALTSKSAFYGKHLYNLASHTGSEFAQGIKGELAESQKVFSDVMDKVIDSAPLGAEPSITLLKKDLAGLQKLIE